MSRSGYHDDHDSEYPLALFRGAVDRAMAGKRGQRAFVDAIAALDAMPEKKLAAHSFSCSDGVCMLGALADHRGVDVTAFELPERTYYDDPVDTDALGRLFDIAPSMCAEVMFMNDEGNCNSETAGERWQRMRDWAEGHIR